MSADDSPLPQDDPKCIVQRYISNITWKNFKQVSSRMICEEQHEIRGAKEGGRPGATLLPGVLLGLECPDQSHLQPPPPPQSRCSI